MLNISAIIDIPTPERLHYSSSSDSLSTSYRKIREKTEWKMSRQEWSTLPRYAVARARAHIPSVGVGVAVDVSRRSSRQILFRKIGLPLSSTTERRQLCVGGSFGATNTRVTCARARLKNFSRLSPRSPRLRHPISPFSLALAKPRYPTNFSCTPTAYARHDLVAVDFFN